MESLPETTNEAEAHFYSRLNKFYDEYFLTSLQRVALTKFITHHFAKQNPSEVDRLKPWLLAKINNQRIQATNPLQKGCPDIIPILRAQPWWDSSEFPWMKNFEDNFEIIRNQVLVLREKKGFQPYRGPSWISKRKAEDGIGYESIDSGSWNVFYLELHNMHFDTNCSLVPKTMEIIRNSIPNNYHHSFFSALTKSSHITPHCGPTNKKLRFHLPLMGVKGSRLRVGEEVRVQEEGKAYVFDDSFNHEAWHEGEETRLILIIDFWHPDLTDVEIKFLSVLQNALFKAQQILASEDETNDNFYSIIQNAKTLLKDNTWWKIEGKEECIFNQKTNENPEGLNNLNFE